jgi:hypothetical protein
MFKTLVARFPWAILIALWITSLSFILPLATDMSALLRAQKTSQVVAVSGPCDFVAFWAAGRLAAVGDAAGAYRLDTILQVEHGNKSSRGLQLPWFYPPTGLLLPRLIQGIPFFSAFLVWDTGMLLLSVLILRLASIPWPVVLIALISPASLLNTDLGQLSFLTSSLFVAGTFAAQTKSRLAGALFGILALKPQAGLLAPVIFIARGRWVAVLIAGVTASALCLLSTALFGFQSWQHYLSDGLKLSRFILIQPFPDHPPPIMSSYEFYGTSVFWMCRSFGLPLVISSAIQSATTLCAVILCWIAWRRPGVDPTARMAFTVCLAALSTPYGYLYDLCAPSIALAALAYQERRLRWSDVLLWTWPVTGLIIALHAYLELAPLIIAATAWRAALAMSAPQPRALLVPA